MSVDSLSLADLQKLGALRPDLALFADRVLVRNYEDFVRILYVDLDRCIAKLEEDPRVRRKDGEDRLTSELINMLNCKDYDVSHDEMVGGHSDIVVRHLAGYIWLGEAKIHKDYAYLEQGFNQLCTRYSPGTPNADQGALVIYVRASNCAAVMAEWKKRLSEIGLPDFTDEPCSARDDLAFFSTHTHEGSGRKIRVRHIAIKQHFNPRDVERRKAAPKIKAPMAASAKPAGVPTKSRTKV